MDVSTQSSRQKYIQNSSIEKHLKRLAAAAWIQVLIASKTRMNKLTIKEDPESLRKWLILAL